MSEGALPQAADPAEAASRRSGGKISCVQVLRGCAALAVVFYHTRLIFSQVEYGSYQMPWIASRGWLGVNCFFILSGFVIAFAHEKDMGQPAAIPGYLWKRVIRVYPIYWVFLTLYLIAARAGMGYGKFGWDFGNLSTAYALVPFTANYSLPLQVAWTLFYEVTFYLLFVAFLVQRKLGWLLFASWASATLVNTFVFHDTAPGILHLWNIYFLVGIGVLHLSRRLDTRTGLPLLLAGIALLAGALVIGGEHMNDAQNNPPLLLVLALPFAVILLGAVLVERRTRWSPPNLFMLLGAASYSVYLVHSPVISLAAILNRHYGHGLVPAMILFLLTALVATIAGVAAHILIERPLLHHLRNLGLSQSGGRDVQPGLGMR